MTLHRAGAAHDAIGAPDVSCRTCEQALSGATSRLEVLQLCDQVAAAVETACLDQLREAMGRCELAVVGYREQRDGICVVLVSFRARANSFSTTSAPTRATGNDTPGRTSISSASSVNSGSMPDDANSRSTTAAVSKSLGAPRRTVASRFYSLLFDDGIDPPPSGGQSTHQRLSSGVVRNRDRQIHVSGKARFRPHRDRQAANEREANRRLVQRRADALECSGECRHGRSQALTRPALSPCSAPGRVRSQSESSCSIRWAVLAS